MVATSNDVEHRRRSDLARRSYRRWLGPKMRSATAMAAALLPNRRSNGVQATVARLVCLQNDLWHDQRAASYPLHYVGYGRMSS